MVDYEITISIDARGSFCPGPMMELIKAIRQSEVGDFVEVLSNDEGSLQDIPAWITKAKHELVDTVKEADFNRFIVKKTW
ncbi:MAG: sulfurtransferase TusA family protein [Candidatus Heimdallarchaeota archaeon]|nr:sulfurtransferase TusA family protein [Candidatus Heimdallarchaeota archaeon]